VNGLVQDRPRLALAFLVALVLAASAATLVPSLGGGFLNWDDDRFVTDNPRVGGLSAENLAWAFGAPRFESYQPLHMVSYMFDGALWPGWAPGYRLHSLALYLAALALLLLLLVHLGLEPVPAALGTLFFGLQPYHAESAAWIAGRKDVLALALGLLAWHAHLAGAGGEGRRRLAFAALSAGLFGAALLAKSAALVLPPMFWVADVLLRNHRPGRAALPLVPHLLLAAAAVVVVGHLWSASDLIREPLAEGLRGRLGLVGFTAWHYLSTAAWPFGLSPLYAEPTPDGLAGPALAAAAVLLALAGWTAVSWRRRRTLPRGPLAAAAWFALGLAPFLNLVPLYYLVADRYLLFPSLAAALGAALLARRILLIRRADRRVLAGAGLLLLALSCGIARTGECRAFRDSRSLWEHAVARQPEAFFARLKLAETLRKDGEARRAADQYRQARRIRPDSRLALMGLFLAELLVDDPGLPEPEANELVLRLGAVADDDLGLVRLESLLRGRGLPRAASVARGRLTERRSR
jgi:tetratricopeptide (TPR) repeat protein